jgi:MoaA/NifB/PqqE/SkfB family radical SAM enzyme
MVKELRLEVNKHCNYGCVHCYTDKHQRELLPIDRVHELLKEVSEAGGTDLSLTGGEPLLDWKRVLSIAQEAKRDGLTVRLNTNGHLLTNEIVTALLPYVDEFQVSLNGADAEFFDSFVQRKGAFARVINGIKRLVEAGAFVTVRSTLMVETAPSLVDTFHLCESLGVRSFKVRAVVPAGSVSVANNGTVLELIRAASLALFAAASTSNMEVRFNDGGAGIPIPKDTPNVSFMGCKCGSDALFVGSDGRVAPCVFLRDYAKYQIGDAATDSLGSIIDSSEALKLFIGEKADGCGNERGDGCRAADLCQAEKTVFSIEADLTEGREISQVISK